MCLNFFNYSLYIFEYDISIDRPTEVNFLSKYKDMQLIFRIKSSKEKRERIHQNSSLDIFLILATPECVMTTVPVVSVLNIY